MFDCLKISYGSGDGRELSGDMARSLQYLQHVLGVFLVHQNYML